MTYAAAPITYSVTLLDGRKKTISTSRIVSCAVHFGDDTVAFCHDYNSARQRIQREGKKRRGGTILRLD